jgi:hypothetical protein
MKWHDASALPPARRQGAAWTLRRGCGAWGWSNTSRRFRAMFVVITVLLLPFFAYREIARVIGKRKLHALLFARANPQS